MSITFKVQTHQKQKYVVMGNTTTGPIVVPVLGEFNKGPQIADLHVNIGGMIIVPRHTTPDKTSRFLDNVYIDHQ